jgi:hypothetical protein
MLPLVSWLIDYGHSASISRTEIEPVRGLLDQGCGLEADIPPIIAREVTARTGRPELELLLGFMREDDELMMTRVDRLARSIGDLRTSSAASRPRACALALAEDAPTAKPNRSAARMIMSFTRPVIL